MSYIKSSTREVSPFDVGKITNLGGTSSINNDYSYFIIKKIDF